MIIISEKQTFPTNIIWSKFAGSRNYKKRFASFSAQSYPSSQQVSHIFSNIRENTRDCQPLLLSLLSLLSLNRLSRYLRLSRLLRLPRLSALEAGGEKVEEAAAALPISPNQFLFPAKFKEFPQLQRSPWPFVKDLGGKIQEGSSGFEEIELILFDCKKQPL